MIMFLLLLTIGTIIKKIIKLNKEVKRRRRAVVEVAEMIDNHFRQPPSAPDAPTTNH